jgi:hypothetical protein
VRAVLVRVVSLAVVLGGVVAMHTLGHATSHDNHDGAAKPAAAGAAMVEPADTTAVGPNSAAGATLRDIGSMGSMGMALERAGLCHSEREDNCPGGGFDYMSVCMAVLTAVAALLVGWLFLRWLTGLVAALRLPPQGPAGRGWGLPPPRTPSLAQLSVLRI